MRAISRSGRRGTTCRTTGSRSSTTWTASRRHSSPTSTATATARCCSPRTMRRSRSSSFRPMLGWPPQPPSMASMRRASWPRSPCSRPTCASPPAAAPSAPSTAPTSTPRSASRCSS
uniref:Uncharacterized protein n=1 Tax=Triticum urartu TaxID=4572 RepID=A0A8R7Q7A7_TRIUA